MEEDASMSALTQESTQESKSNARISMEQREKMLSFMKDHHLLATGRLQGVGAAAAKAKLLEEMARLLNASGSGATKTGDEWMKSWQDWRSDVKSKASKIRRYQNETGGGPPCKVVLTPLEEELLAFIGEFVVTGHTSVPDPLEATSVPEILLQPPSPDRPVLAIEPISCPAESFLDLTSADAGVNLSSHVIRPTPPPSTGSSHSSGTPSTSSAISKRRKRNPSGMSELDERLLSSAEEQSHSYVTLVKIKERQAAASEREAAASERQAAAAEEQAIAMRAMSEAENASRARQAMAVQSMCDAVTASVKQQAVAIQDMTNAVTVMSQAVSSTMRTFELYLQMQMRNGQT